MNRVKLNINSLESNPPERTLKAEATGIPDATRLLPRKHVALLLGVSAATLKRWEREGYLPKPIRTLSRCLYSHAMIKEVRALIEKKLQHASAVEPEDSI
jgi:predicted DNA-binding transcriptional regulator AlpA